MCLKLLLNDPILLGWSESVSGILVTYWLRDQVTSKQEVNVFDSLINIFQYCRDGASQSGIYLASHWLLEQASSEQEVDVFDTVRQIQVTRPQFISNTVIVIYTHINPYKDGYIHHKYNH